MQPSLAAAAVDNALVVAAHLTLVEAVADMLPVAAEAVDTLVVVAEEDMPAAVVVADMPVVVGVGVVTTNPNSRSTSGEA